MIIGTGVSRLRRSAKTQLTRKLLQGTVHNLYRNNWSNVVRYRDNFAQTKPPEQWALDFRTEAKDALTLNTVSLLIYSGPCAVCCMRSRDPLLTRSRISDRDPLSARRPCA